MADFTALNAAVAAAIDQGTKTVGLEDSAEVIINAQGTATATAVADALKKQDGITQPMIDAATAAVMATTKVFADSSDKLGAAIAANPGPTPPTP